MCIAVIPSFKQSDKKKEQLGDWEQTLAVISLITYHPRNSLSPVDTAHKLDVISCDYLGQTYRQD